MHVFRLTDETGVFGKDESGNSTQTYPSYILNKKLSCKKMVK